MRRETTETVRSTVTKRSAPKDPANRLNPTKQAHEKLLRALSDRRLKRAFGD
jgi:hypothetical protein